MSTTTWEQTFFDISDIFLYGLLLGVGFAFLSIVFGVILRAWRGH